MSVSLKCNKSSLFQDGRPLSLEEIWKSIPDVYQQRLKNERWTFLTQQVSLI